MGGEGGGRVTGTEYALQCLNANDTFHRLNRNLNQNWPEITMEASRTKMRPLLSNSDGR